MAVDKEWLRALLERNPLKLAREANVPVLANQWGVKRSVSEARAPADGSGDSGESVR